MSRRNKKIVIYSIILSLFSLVLIASYSFFNFEENSNSVSMNAGIINIVMNNDGGLSFTGEFPSEYDDILELENDDNNNNDHKMDFSLESTNNSTETFYYSLKVMEGNDISSKTRLDPKYISFDLVEIVSGTEYYYLRNAILADYLNTNIIANKIDPSTSLNRTFYLRAWINDDLVVGDIIGTMSYSDFINSYGNITVQINCDTEYKESAFSYIKKDGRRNTTGTGIYSSDQDPFKYYNNSDHYMSSSNKYYYITASMNNDEDNRQADYFLGNYKFFKNKLLNTTTINFKKVSTSEIESYINNKVKANDLAPAYGEENCFYDVNDTSDTADYFDHTDYSYDGHKTIGYFTQTGYDSDSNPIYEYNIVSDGIIVFPEDASNMFNLDVYIATSTGVSNTKMGSGYGLGYHYNSETSSSYSINYLRNIEYINFDNVYTGNTTDFGYIFMDLQNLKEIDLSKLDTHNGVRMAGLFTWCKGLETLDVNYLDLSRATNIGWLFSGLNLDISEDGTVDDFCGGLQNLDVHRVTTITDVFTNCPNIKRLDLRSWYTGTLEYFGMKCAVGPNDSFANNFSYGADTNANIKETYYLGAIMGQDNTDFSTLKYLDISNFDISNITSMYGLFEGYSSLTTLKIDNWDTSNVINFELMFSYCKKLTNFDTSIIKVTNKAKSLARMFEYCPFTEIDVDDWDTSNVTDLTYMFCWCNKLKTLDVSKWNVSNVVSFSNVFFECEVLESIDVSNWVTTNGTNFGYLFSNCKKITSVDLSKFDFSNATSFAGMFSSCINLTTINCNWFNTVTNKLTSMDYMFSNCNKLTSIDFSTCTGDFSSVKTLYNFLFKNYALTLADLTPIVGSNITKFDSTFAYCSVLTTIYVNNSYASATITQTSTAFYGCNALVGQNGTKYSVENVANSTYAKIDTAVYDTDETTLLSGVQGYFSVHSTT